MALEPHKHSARAAPRELHVGYAVPRRDWLDRWRDWLIMRRGSENREVGRRWRLAQALLGVAVVGVAGLIIGWLVMDPARGPESLPSADPAGVGCVAEPGAQQRDIDTDDSPEFPWGHTPGEEVTVYFETGELPARYVQMVETGARTWSRSPCIKALAVDRCPGGTNCTKVLVEERGDDRDTDGESAGVQRDGSASPTRSRCTPNCLMTPPTTAHSPPSPMRWGTPSGSYTAMKARL